MHIFTCKENCKTPNYKVRVTVNVSVARWNSSKTRASKKRKYLRGIKHPCKERLICCTKR